MATTRPDVSYPSVKLSQSNVCPADIHFSGAKSTFKFLYNTRSDGIYFWRTKEVDLPRVDPPHLIRSNLQDLLMDGRPEHGPLDLHSYADSDWAACPKTRRSFGGICIRLAGGTVGYKCKFHSSIATSSTHAEFMSAHDAARNGSILWGLDVPQEEQQYYTKIMMLQPQWEMLENLLLVLVTLISNISLYVIGSNEI